MAQAHAQPRPVLRWEQVFFAVVGLSALWIGAWGYFAPTLQKAIPFSIPPLHARFLGAMYLSAVVLELGGFRARNWREAAIVPVVTSAWTGGIFLVSVLHTEIFDFGTLQTWIWFVAYAVYPLIALAQLVRRRSDLRPAGSNGLPGWVNRYLTMQGALLLVVAVALLVGPALMAELWPWPITVALAQLYFAPFLAFGLASSLLGRVTMWTQVKVGALTLLVFTTGVLIASILHWESFSMREVSDVVWFAVFGGAVVAMASISRKAVAGG